MRVTVWLIHGTWARRAQWARDGSPLRKALQEGLKAEVVFATVAWTGNNNAMDRAEASCRFLSAVQNSAHGADMNFVVAHSHGGNIAANAIFTEMTQDQIAPGLLDGVITLNTPFLTDIPRSSGQVAIHQILLACGIMFLALTQLSLDPLIKWLLGISLPILTWALMFLVPWFFSKRARAIIMAAPRVGDVAFTSPTKRPTSILCIHTRDDEAYGWLGLTESVLNAPYLLLHKIPLVATLAVIGLIQGYLFWGTLFHMGSGVRVGILFVLSVLGTFLSLWTILALGALVTTYLVRALVFGEGLGGFALLKALASRLMVSLTPLFHSNAELLLTESKFSGWLRHSDIYENRFVLKRMVGWINQRIAHRQQS